VSKTSTRQKKKTGDYNRRREDSRERGGRPTEVGETLGKEVGAGRGRGGGKLKQEIEALKHTIGKKKI